MSVSDSVCDRAMPARWPSCRPPHKKLKKYANTTDEWVCVYVYVCMYICV
jgi:hypothetical protein